MSLAILPMFAIVAALPAPCSGDECVPISGSSSPAAARIAQVQLAEALAAADSIDSIRADGHTITFAIDIAGEAFEVAATTGARGAVISLVTTDRGRGPAERGELSWLAGELVDSVAVTQLSTTSGGAVKLATNDGRTYLAIPVRTLGGNGAVESRWAAAWD